MCGGLPLALRLAAARLANTDGIRDLVDDLRTSGQGLTMLAVPDDERSLRTTFASTYRALSCPAARLFRLSSVSPGPDLSSELAAAITGDTISGAQRLLAELADAHLFTIRDDGRYGRHDLLRLYAHERHLAEDSPEDRELAEGRLAGWYSAQAAAANRMLTARRNVVEPDLTHAPDLPIAQTPETMVAWLDTERANLLAYLHALDPSSVTAWQLPYLLYGYFVHRGRWPENVAIQRIALDAAQHQGRAEEAEIARGNLGLAHVYARQFDEAIPHVRATSAYWRERGDRQNEARSLANLAFIHDSRGEYDEALAVLRCALEILEDGTDQPQLAIVLQNLGHVLVNLGRGAEALPLHERALHIAQAIGDGPLEANARTNLAEAHLELGNEEAEEHFHGALALVREQGDQGFEAIALAGLGRSHLRRGEPDAAIWFLREALVLRRQSGDLHEEAALLTEICRASLLLGDVGTAAQALDQAESLRRRVPDPGQEMEIMQLRKSVNATS